MDSINNKNLGLKRPKKEGGLIFKSSSVINHRGNYETHGQEISRVSRALDGTLVLDDAVEVVLKAAIVWENGEEGSLGTFEKAFLQATFPEAAVYSSVDCERFQRLSVSEKSDIRSEVTFRLNERK